MEPRDRFAVNLRQARQEAASPRKSWPCAANCTGPRSRCSSAAAANRAWARWSSSRAPSAPPPKRSAPGSAGTPKARQYKIDEPSYRSLGPIPPRAGRLSSSSPMTLGRAEEAIRRRRGSDRALLISSIAWSSGICWTACAQRAGDQRAEGAGFFGVVDGADEAGADRLAPASRRRCRSARSKRSRASGVASARASVSRETPSWQAAPSRAEIVNWLAIWPRFCGVAPLAVAGRGPGPSPARTRSRPPPGRRRPGPARATIAPTTRTLPLEPRPRPLTGRPSARARSGTGRSGRAGRRG